MESASEERNMVLKTKAREMDLINGKRSMGKAKMKREKTVLATGNEVVAGVTMKWYW